MAFNGGNCGEIKMQEYVIKNVNKLNSERVKVTEERLWLLCTQKREKACDKQRVFQMEVEGRRKRECLDIEGMTMLKKRLGTRGDTRMTMQGSHD